MITLRQIERFWTGKNYERLFRELIAARPEGTLRAQMQLGQPASTAAMGVIRLFELNQEYTPVYATLLRAVLGAQSESDGGWGDPMTTALCLRALLQCNGSGPAISRGLHYLASIQKTEGIWPDVPIRRLPADPYASAFVLYQLAEYDAFRSAVRFFDAVNWFEANEMQLDPESRLLWDRAATRCRRARHAPAMGLWS
jgi:hypothetical protein